jgi:hypothetical protein
MFHGSCREYSIKKWTRTRVVLRELDLNSSMFTSTGLMELTTAGATSLVCARFAHN